MIVFRDNELYQADHGVRQRVESLFYYSISYDDIAMDVNIRGEFVSLKKDAFNPYGESVISTKDSLIFLEEILNSMWWKDEKAVSFRPNNLCVDVSGYSIPEDKDELIKYLTERFNLAMAERLNQVRSMEAGVHKAMLLSSAGQEGSTN